MDLLKYDRGLAPVASDVVYDAKKLNDLKIVHVTSHAGPLTGGAEMTLLCDKYTGQNPDVVFDDGRGWSQTATAKIYHKQLAIVFTAPPYREDRDPRSPDYLQVQVYLQQCTDRGVLRSQPATVKYVFSENNSQLQFPKPPPAGYLANIYAKNKRISKSSTKTSDPCAMPSTSTQNTQMPPFSPYQNTKMSYASYQEYSPPVFDAFNGHGQYLNNGNSYRQLNASNIPDDISNINNSQRNNMALCNTKGIHGNNTISNIQYRVDTPTANPHRATVLPEANIAPGSYTFSARIPPGTKVKRSVSEHNRGKHDSDELSPKREKIMTPDYEYLACDANNQFHDSNFPIENEELPTSGEERVIQTLINDPLSKDIFDKIFMDLYTAEAWYQNTLDQNNIGNSIQNDEVSINNNYNLNQNVLPHNVSNTVNINDHSSLHNVGEIDFENALSADLKRGLNVSE
ncbi:probable protein kinase DDB_G0277539 isoform X2 [Leguminivora glycinivorella]|uniref:probable protein kinase DDB_G0277539 isoform X2 n=1 Tax=Leguminivora glycinivorella TaxID=1035111 RepID=UPI00200E47D6|nr:probable protein kinase DDB_G0277539 isoform X2 [Leguminivora glycinivorella]